MCFLKGSKILCEDGYQLIECLKPGCLVKTFKHGFISLEKIKRETIKINFPELGQLYCVKIENYPDLTEDLVITAGHSILIDKLSEPQRVLMVSNHGCVFVTETKYRLPIYLDERSGVYGGIGTFEIYHLCLDNPDPYGNYGIYANGILVESSCKRNVI